MSAIGSYLEVKLSREDRLARAYAESELICEFRDRARHERMIIENVFPDCPIDRLRSMKEHEAKAELLDAICEAILGGEL